MPVFASHEFHTFSWIDIQTSDRTAAKQFYGGLLGWDFKDMLMPDGRIMYTVARLNGYDVAGRSELMPEQIKAGMPAFWNSYICVEDVRASLAQCLELCAQLMIVAIDIPNAVSMAMVMEPNGALFSLWQPAEHVGMQVRNQPGAPCWFELDTNDVIASAEFYGAAFKWTTKKDPNNPLYTLFNSHGAVADDGNVCGMMKMQPDWGEVHPNWLLYFQVGNVDASVNLALELGGESLHEAMDFPYGHLIALKDPQNGVFGLMEMSQ